MYPTSAISQTPSSPRRAELHTVSSATGTVPADTLLHRHRATASAHCCPLGVRRPPHLSPRGSQPALRPAAAAAAMAEPRHRHPFRGLALLCSTLEAGSGPRHLSIYSSHTLRARTALMRTLPERGIGLHLPAPHPQESGAVTRAPGLLAPRPAGQDGAETLRSAACAPSLAHRC